jgi:DNA helicase-2/ATP-dependent DNA helicase PcrA
VIMTGVEENIFPHSRSIESTAALEEERRLCYVGMTRAEEQLILTCARQRRRYGGGAPDWMTPSRFLQEIPPEVMTDLSTMPSLLSYQQQSYQQQAEGMDLLSERNEVRQAVEKRVYDGPTYDSVDNLAGFFSNRGLPVPNSVRQPRSNAGAPTAKQTGGGAVRRPLQARGTGRTHGGGFRLGAKVRHRKFGVGTVMKSEGDGAESKLTVHFQGYGIKKLVARFAGLVPA